MMVNKTLPAVVAPLIAAAVLCTVGVSPSHAQDAAALTASGPAPAHAVWLDTLDLSAAQQGYGVAASGAAKSVDGASLTLHGQTFAHGFGTHAVGKLRVILEGAATHFAALVGVDDETKGQGSVTFSVAVDGKTVAQTGVLHGRDAPQLLSVDLTGAHEMDLEVGDGGDGITYDHADWAGALLTLAPGTTTTPHTYLTPITPARMTMPAADPHPAIHGPQIVGATPTRPFLFMVPATGQGPLTFSAKGLPNGLMLDAHTGIISGTLGAAGRTRVLLTVRGPEGKAARILTIVGGKHMLALTPPMGWNSWNVWAGAVDDAKVRAAADEMIASGLAGHGYGYCNIDDTWEAGRDAQGNIQTNAKFPDMKALSAYVHGKGLRFGIYSSPGPLTCGEKIGSYQHEKQDAISYANWGFDYLKYDWCSYDNIVHGDHSLPALQKPYAVMSDALDHTSRDILFSLCQYGMGDVWNWGATVGGNCWRTTGDIEDDWGSVKGIFTTQAGHEADAGPGHWNDPDMLMVGYVGFGNPHPNRLTPNEQITHMSMWCLLAAPLLIGCDLTRLDSLTLALLTNDEALDIDQDPLGKAASRVAQTEQSEVWSRPLADGTRAVGLVNLADDPAPVTVRWADIGLTGAQPVRDLWMHQNVGAHNGLYTVQVPAHGTVLLRIGKDQTRL